MRDGECGDHEHERAQPSKRDHEAEQKQQMIGPVEDVTEPQRDEPQRRLVPPRIQPHQPWIAVQLECAHRAVWRDDADDGDHAQAEPRERWLDREAGSVRANRILEEDVEHPLIPVKARGVRQSCAGHVRERLAVRFERSIRRQRDADAGDGRRGQSRVLLVDRQIVRDPHQRRIAQRGVRARQIEIAGSAERELDVAHRRKRRAHDHAQMVTFGFDERLHDDVGGDVVRGGREGRRERQRGGRRRDYLPPEGGSHKSMSGTAGIS